MALINCSDCGGKISDKATVCVKCGNPAVRYSEQQYVTVKEYKPIYRRAWFISLLIVFIGLSIVAIAISTRYSNIEAENFAPRDLARKTLLAYVRDNLSETDARNLESTIRSIPNVASVTFVSRDEAAEQYFDRHDNAERYGYIDSIAFRHRYEVLVDDVRLTDETKQVLLSVGNIENIVAPLVFEGAERRLLIPELMLLWIALIVVSIIAIAVFLTLVTLSIVSFIKHCTKPVSES